MEGRAGGRSVFGGTAAGKGTVRYSFSEGDNQPGSVKRPSLLSLSGCKRGPMRQKKVTQKI